MLVSQYFYFVICRLVLLKIMNLLRFILSSPGHMLIMQHARVPGKHMPQIDTALRIAFKRWKLPYHTFLSQSIETMSTQGTMLIDDNHRRYHADR